MMKRLSGLVLLLCLANFLSAQDMRMDTYCNPLNIDYTYMIYNSDKNISYRSGADPAVVEFRGEYYMFVTRSHGYWRSRDLLNWEFVRPGRNWYPQGCNAPAAHNYKDSVLYVTGDPSGSMSILYTDNPASGNWEAVPAILHNLQDPDLFIDDDGKAYMFWGSSNVYPIRGMELDKNRRFIKKGETKELFNLDMPKHGWERFGENHTDTVLKEDDLMQADGSLVKNDAAFQTSYKGEIANGRLHVFVCDVDGQTKYVLPIYGAGLWGPIWGYIALNDDKDTVYGVYFSHQGETPGLGAEITTTKFQDQFLGKHVMENGTVALGVEKHGKVAKPDYQVDGISGGTITSKGVDAMIKDCLSMYNSFLTNK